jgi:DNA integrity scanning protein DisA with diadenylate cyclase activity
MNPNPIQSNLGSRVSPIELELARSKIARELRKRLNIASELLALGRVSISEALEMIQSKTAEEYMTRAQEEDKAKKQQLYLLTRIEGVDSLLAEDLLDEFGSLEAINKATPDELTIVPGIDIKKARKIARELPKIIS